MNDIDPKVDLVNSLCDINDNSNEQEESLMDLVDSIEDINKKPINIIQSTIVLDSRVDLFDSPKKMSMTMNQQGQRLLQIPN